MAFLYFIAGHVSLQPSKQVSHMTDFTPPTRINDAATPRTVRRAYVTPAITFASADEGPEGKMFSFFRESGSAYAPS